MLSNAGERWTRFGDGDSVRVLDVFVTEVNDNSVTAGTLFGTKVEKRR